MNTKNNTTESIHSPKNRYHAEINYPKAIKGIGSVQSFSSNDFAHLEALVKESIIIAKSSAVVKFMENRQNYPSFDWHTLQVVAYFSNGEMKL